MTLSDSLRSDFTHEARTTRRHLERLAEDRFPWRPHPKSYTAIELASHIVENFGFTAPIFVTGELSFDTSSYRPYVAGSAAELMQRFDRDVAEGERVLAGVTDAGVNQRWQMKVNGKVRLEKSKAEAFRDFVLNHVIHHRGQLSVYLRLMDVPVPASYGPTADES